MHISAYQQTRNFIHRLSAYTHLSMGDSTFFFFSWKGEGPKIAGSIDHASGSEWPRRLEPSQPPTFSFHAYLLAHALNHSIGDPRAGFFSQKPGGLPLRARSSRSSKTCSAPYLHGLDANLLCLTKYLEPPEACHVVVDPRARPALRRS
jgi:hypothetical protein